MCQDEIGAIDYQSGKQFLRSADVHIEPYVWMRRLELRNCGGQLIARSKGVPVVALAVIYRRNPFVLFSLAKSGIKTPADYVGKKVGVKIGGNEELIYRAVLARAEIDKSKLTEIPIKFDITPLLTGTVDVWPGYLINEVLAAKEKGFDVNIVYPSDSGIDLYADTLFTTEKMLKEKPELVKKFVAATLKGWNTAIAAPEEAAKITIKYGDKLTYDHELAMMKASVPLLKPDSKPVGFMDEGGWGSAQNLLLTAGLQKERINLAKAFTTQAMP
jgi:NitT/TauT family transport system substrate-binding protein